MSVILSYLSSSGVIIILLTVQFSKSRCIDSFYRLPLPKAFVKNFFYLFLNFFSFLSFFFSEVTALLYYHLFYSLVNTFFSLLVKKYTPLKSGAYFYFTSTYCADTHALVPFCVLISYQPFFSLRIVTLSLRCKLPITS